jgi:DNA-binding response OmpR family regulator
VSDQQVPPRVLVVEDDEPFAFALAHNLRREGYRVLTARRGDDGLALARERQPDLVILDVMLPGLDGTQVCRLLRRERDVPVIMVSALGGETSKVAGLDLGADDYLAKPFAMRELMARVRSLLRRARARGEPDTRPSLVVSADLLLDLERHEARLEGRVLHMKPKEFQLLAFLMQHPDRVFTREQLLDQIWGSDFVGGQRTVDVHVRWLRSKIERDQDNPVRLRTVRGVGYLFQRGGAGGSPDAKPGAAAACGNAPTA